MVSNSLFTSQAFIDPAYLPGSFDWRNNGGDWTTPVRDQGQCNSCWAFADTAVFESYWERVNGDPWLNPDFSEQYLVSCNAKGCNCDTGGYITALEYYVRTEGKSGGVGTVLETDFPYVSSTGDCSPCKDLFSYVRYKVREGASWEQIEDLPGIPSQDRIKSTVFQYGPVAAGMYMPDTPESFLKTGIMEEIPGFELHKANHAVVIVGWGHDAVKNKDYWICKNSYGTSWGDQGWFKVYVNNFKIGTDAVYLKTTDTRSGSLSITSVPSGAAIHLDGSNTGQKTDTLIQDVSSGPHTLVLKAEGYQEYTVKGYVRPVETWYVRAKLERNRETTVSVTSVPDNAAIWLDGKDTGLKTNTVFPITPGVHALKVERPGYLPVTRDISVQEGMYYDELFVLDPGTVPTPSLTPLAPAPAPATPTPLPTVTPTTPVPAQSPTNVQPTATMTPVPSRDPKPSPTATVTTTVTTPRPTVTVTPSTTPGVVIGAYPREGRPPVRVRFSDLTLSDRTGWFWEFGDGMFSEEENPLHTYAEEGEYTVKLTVQTGSGTSSAEKNRYIIIRPDLPPPPEPTAVPTRAPTPSVTPAPTVQPTVTPTTTGPVRAEFTASPRSGPMPLEVTFSGSSTGSPSRWSWAFGDGTFSDEKTPVHSYSEPGEYPVRLTVQGGGGTSTVEKAAYILVTGP